MDISYQKLLLDHFDVFLACFQKEMHWTPKIITYHTFK